MTGAGELILSGLPAGPLDRGTRELLAAAGFAGYLLLRRNTGVPDELVRLVESLDPGSGPPPAIAIDEEGGMVSRLEHLGLRAPSALALGALEEPARAATAARLSGRVLRALGVNVVLGPCLDVLSEPRNPIIATRSFGVDPDRVADFGLAALAGYREIGLRPVIKHFPGHGGTRADSHVAQPAVEGDPEQLRRCELKPFRAALGAGVDAVMTAHVRYPAATPAPEQELPATLSSYWLDGVLRRELGFGGVVLSDAMEMQGVRGGRRIEDAVAAGLRAGIDLFVCEDLENALRVRGHLLALADGGGPAARRLEEARARVRRWRSGLACGASACSPTQALLEVGPQLEALQSGAVALVGDPAGVLPLPPEAPLLVVLPRELSADHPVDIEFLRRAVRARFPRGRVIALEPEPTDGEVRLLGELVAADPTLGVVLGVLGRRAERWIRDAVEALGQAAGGRVGVALHRPVDARALPRGWARLVSYGFGRPALGALLEVLAGRQPARGRLLAASDDGR